MAGMSFFSTHDMAPGASACGAFNGACAGACGASSTSGCLGYDGHIYIYRLCGFAMDEIGWVIYGLIKYMGNMMLFSDLCI